MVQEFGLREDGRQHEIDFLNLNALNISHFAAAAVIYNFVSSIQLDSIFPRPRTRQ